MESPVLLVVPAVLMGLGALGAITSRSAVKALISLEVMFNGALLALLMLASRVPDEASSLALLAISLSGVEVGVLISIFVLLFRRTRSVDVYEVPGLRGGENE
ncbi:NADH-quinone oxidoreductase subunit NuoK [Infirmifilum sp. NZ]|uniref:NADH-quinone oxidoreductase subunit NuoK n=1 Tax=Infirmifilum sp. NZ TaxID=2926850 RepID=UPI0027AA1629|nr:NADH-quinone oxidoreductase subunit K [Infirmifilum sp. NZ]UNQ73111.1 NADH-quinone oxidoreductase subunit K [Infirmifilum sp. NZ]